MNLNSIFKINILSLISSCRLQAALSEVAINFHSVLASLFISRWKKSELKQTRQISPSLYDNGWIAIDTMLSSLCIALRVERRSKTSHHTWKMFWFWAFKFHSQFRAFVFYFFFAFSVLRFNLLILWGFEDRNQSNQVDYKSHEFFCFCCADVFAHLCIKFVIFTIIEF